MLFEADAPRQSPGGVLRWLPRYKSDLTPRFKEIDQVRGEVARTKVDLIKWIVPLMFAQVAAIAALVKLL